MLFDSNWSSKPKKHKAARDEKETRQSRVMQKGWLWTNVYLNVFVNEGIKKRAMLGEGKDNVGSSQVTSISYFLSLNFSVSRLTKEKQRNTNTYKSGNQPTREVLLQLYPWRVCMYVCMIVCQAMKTKIPEKKKNIEREKTKCLQRRGDRCEKKRKCCGEVLFSCRASGLRFRCSNREVTIPCIA